MICVLLIYFGLFQNADSSLEYFGQRRTDLNVSEKFQGVETASQIRYVSYFEKLLRLSNLKYPQNTDLEFEEIRIFGTYSACPIH